MKYKVGDVVRVRRDLIEHKTYYMEDRAHYDRVMHRMCDLRGQKVTIESYGYNKYQIKECGFNWTDEMFEDSKLEDFLRCLKSEMK